MILQSLLLTVTLASSALGCAQHTNNKLPRLQGRQDGVPLQPVPEANTTKNDWAYEASFNWGRIKPEYRLCQIGTQQAPIALSLGNGLALDHIPKFAYNGSVAGNWYNWGYGPAFTVARTNQSYGEEEAEEEEADVDWTTHPSFTYDNTTVYLKGWHIHAPADHSVGGDKSKAEMHLVHVDASGHEAAVLAIRLDPGNSDAPFFAQLPPMIGFDELDVEERASVAFESLLESVLYFGEFWTYHGSLTSPPCTEGIRWFVARQIVFIGVEQMQAILGASTYSARAEQEVWLHRINE
ncbi:carbonic anhydrase [Decorospora gaudefroyi]|uniref:Carbonic anhydrase n=1 Tax=Decorospora gaudefroyi TaxID=184978 RepID=A0A6A5KGL8_9PLEO|nr:carbonic anhydrase [Decorospora gaudefroyi]